MKFQLNSEFTDGRWYYGDKERLRQIIFNLLSNAVKFTEAGFVAIGLSEESCDEENYLIIKVQDTGIGIAQESLGKIFDPLNRRNHTQHGVLVVQA